MSRSNNFSSEEVNVLLTCVESMRGLVSGGIEFKNPAAQTKAWTQIANIVNSVGKGTERTDKNVKNKWFDLKYRTKKKAAEMRRIQSSKSGSGPSCVAKFNDAEERILQLIGETSKERRIVLDGNLTKTQSDKTKDGSKKGESWKADDVLSMVSFNGESLDFEESAEDVHLEVKRKDLRKKRLKDNEEDLTSNTMRSQKQNNERIQNLIEQSTESNVKLDDIISLLIENNEIMHNVNNNLNVLIDILTAKQQ